MERLKGLLLRRSRIAAGALAASIGLGTFAGAVALADLFCEPQFAFDPDADSLVADVPDIAQVRAGLPNNGRKYCGPTAAADWTKWLANHGYAELINEGWDDTELVRQLGSAAYMDTNPNSGTGPNAVRLGWWRYLDWPYPGCFTVTYRGLDNEDDCMPLDKIDDFILFHLALGNYPLVRVGYYDEATGARCGGHYMAVVGQSTDGDGVVSLSLCDPANPNGIDTYELAERLLGGTNRVKLVGRTRTKQCNGTGPTIVYKNYLDGAVVAAPRRVIVFEDNRIKVLNVCEPDLFVTTYVSAQVRHAITLPDSLTIYGTALGGANVVRLDLRTGASSIFATPSEGLSNPGAMARDIRGGIWVANQGSSPYSVVLLDESGNFVRGISRSQLPNAADLAYDPSRDHLYAIDPTTSRIVRILGSPACSWSIPPVSGDVHLAVLPDGRLVYDSDADSALHLLAPTATGCGATVSSFFHPAMSNPAGLFTDETGQVWVSDPTAQNLFVFDRQGALRRSLAGWPTRFGRLLGTTEAMYSVHFASYAGDDVDFDPTAKLMLSDTRITNGERLTIDATVTGGGIDQRVNARFRVVRPDGSTQRRIERTNVLLRAGETLARRVYARTYSASDPRGTYRVILTIEDAPSGIVITETRETFTVQ